MATIAEKYAQAIYDARLETKLSAAEFSRAIEASLKKRNHDKLLPRILEEYAKLTSRKSEHDATVRVASAKEEHAAIAKARELGAQNPKVKHDHSLVRGFVIEGRDFRFDASARRALINLYARLTA